MGKSSKKSNQCLPPCGSCEPMYPYRPQCAIPRSCEPSCEGIYVNLCDRSLYCKSVFYSDNYTTITNSVYAISGTFGVNNGVPVAIWDEAACEAYVQFPIPFYLQELGKNSNTASEAITILTALYDGNNQQSAVAAPALGVDCKTTAIGDTTGRFVKSAFPIFPVSASIQDIDGNVSMFHIVSSAGIDIRVSVAATKFQGFGESLFTKVVAVEDITNPCCKVPLNFSTFRLQSFGTEDAQATPVFFTFVMNSCCEFSLGLFHGDAAGTPAASIFPADDSNTEFTWPQYNMVGVKGGPCPLADVDTLNGKFGRQMLDTIYAQMSSLFGSANVTLQMLLGAVVTPPGDLTTVQIQQMVHDSSESLVQMWRDGVTDFNAFLLTL